MKKKILSLVLSSIMVLGVVACSKDAGEKSDTSKPNEVTVKKDAETPSGEKVKYGATYMTMNNPFFGAMNDMIKEKVEANGDTLITLDPALDQQKQISQIEDMITEGIDVLFLNPVDWKGVKPALDACREANVLVINVDAPVFDEELVDCIVASDNVEAGKVCGEDLMKRLDGGDIVLITHPTAKSGEDRIGGFEKLVFANENYKNVGSNDSVGQLENALPIMEDFLLGNENIKAVMALNDPSAQGAISALKTAGYKQGDILVYGVDGSPDAKKLIEDGWMTATAAQSPKNIGATAVEMARKLLNKESVEKVILVPVILITKDNVAEFGTDGWQ